MSGRQSPQAGEQKPLPPIVVKKYANRRLYNTETSSYVTLDDLAAMIRDGRDFVVYDAKTGEDITRGVLTQIIVEQEGKGQNMLPTAVLRQLIGLYGDNLQSLVPRYLEAAMASFSQQQEQMRDTLSKTMGGFIPFPAPCLTCRKSASRISP
jgi:polyhydroxyalkanoate synthesis repressor PhaR